MACMIVDWEGLGAREVPSLIIALTSNDEQQSFSRIRIISAHGGSA